MNGLTTQICRKTDAIHQTHTEDANDMLIIMSTLIPLHGFGIQFTQNSLHICLSTAIYRHSNYSQR